MMGLGARPLGFIGFIKVYGWNRSSSLLGVRPLTCRGQGGDAGVSG